MDIPIDPTLQLCTTSVRCRYIEATESERMQLYTNMQTNSKATQHELARWFNTKFEKEINQSTVSRMYYYVAYIKNILIST